MVPSGLFTAPKLSLELRLALLGVIVGPFAKLNQDVFWLASATVTKIAAAINNNTAKFLLLFLELLAISTPNNIRQKLYYLSIIQENYPD